MKSFSYAFINVLGIVLIIILLSNLLFLDSQTPLTFRSFLDFISSQNIDFSYQPYIDYTIQGDWSLFNFLRDFFNLFITALNYVIFMIKIFLELLSFVGATFQFLFFR